MMAFLRFLIALYCVFGLLAPAFSAEKKTVSRTLYKKLQQSEKRIAEKAYDRARDVLQAALQSAQNDYEKALVLRSLGAVYALQGRYRKAAQWLEKTLALQALTSDQKRQVLYDLGQLYMAGEQYQKAVTILHNSLVNAPAANAEIYAMLANAYAQLKQYRPALKAITQAIQRSKKVPEAWYQLKLALFYELEDYASASHLLKHLISLYPDKKSYWQQLVSVYQQLRRYKEAASIKHLAYKKGLFSTQKEILELVQLLLYIDAPYKAADLLSQEITRGRVENNAKNQELLANAWTQAREFDKAIAALREASRKSDKGELYLRLGQLFVEQEQWQKAVQALTKALQKGQLKQPGSTYLLLGMSYFELKRVKPAREAFRKALKYRQTKTAAVQWLEYIDAGK